MNLKFLKLFVVALFLAFAAGAFLFSSAKRSQAQTGKSDAQRDEVLQRFANYKVWQQVLKPEKPADAAENKAQPVFSGTIYG